MTQTAREAGAVSNHLSDPNGSDVLYWTQLFNGFGAIVAFVAGMVSTGALALWRLATWSRAIEARFEIQDERERAEREEKTRLHAALMDELRQMQKLQDERHDMTLRELDQINTSVAADRGETRAMSSRMAEILSRFHS